jgi:hypothetical protein
MSRFAPSAWARKGWRALALSLALHGAVVGLVALLAARGGRPVASGTGPVAVDVIEEEGEESEVYLIPAPPARNPAPRQVGVVASHEEIVPVTHAPPAPSPGGSGKPTTSPGSEAAGAVQGDSTSGGGRPGPASFFQIGTRAERIVYVIDRSSSMGFNGLLAAAVRELLVSVDRLAPTVRFQVVVYNDTAELVIPGQRELMPASPENLARVRTALAGLRAESSTAHLPALRLALSLSPQVIYLLTDADDLTDDDRREATRLNRGRAVIHTVELNTANRGRADMPLQVLARENGGRYQAVEPR